MSDQDNSIFESSTPDQENGAAAQQAVNTAEAPQADPYATMLQMIKTEDGRQKYNSVEDAISSIPHAQSHISKLEAELAQLKAAQVEREKEAAKLQTLEDISKPAEAPQVQPQVGMDESQISELVNQALESRTRAERERANVEQVTTALMERFGDAEATKKVVQQKAAELGVAPEYFMEQAKASPKVALSLFGVVQGASAPAKSTGTVNTTGMPSTQPTERGRNPLLSGNQADMQAAYDRIKAEVMKGLEN